MLDDAYAEEQRLKQLAEAEEGDSTVSKSTNGTSSGSTGAVQTPNPLGLNNTYIKFSNGAESYIDNTGLLVVYTGGVCFVCIKIYMVVSG